jgi:hypothetical protein
MLPPLVKLRLEAAAWHGGIADLRVADLQKLMGECAALQDKIDEIENERLKESKENSDLYIRVAFLEAKLYAKINEE